MTRKLMFLSIYTVTLALVVLGLTQSSALVMRSTQAAAAPIVEPVQGASATNPCGLNVNITATARKGQQGNNDIVQVNWEFKALPQCMKVDKTEVEVTITRGGTPSVGKFTINGNGTVATVSVPRVAPGTTKTPSTIKATVKSSASLATTNTDVSQALIGAEN
ncbi:MAG: hypothetical protein WBV94_34195 [Blastocatellia bacterium]